jgi:hypothetical protein
LRIPYQRAGGIGKSCPFDPGRQLSRPESEWASKASPRYHLCVSPQATHLSSVGQVGRRSRLVMSATTPVGTSSPVRGHRITTKKSMVGPFLVPSRVISVIHRRKQPETDRYRVVLLSQQIEVRADLRDATKRSEMHADPGIPIH